MSINERENYLQSVEMTGPEYIPIQLRYWGDKRYKNHKQVDDLIRKYSIKFMEFYLFRRHSGRRPRDPRLPLQVPRHCADSRYVDEWGCEWYFLHNGMEGQVVKHPLEDWSAFDSYNPPPGNDTFLSTPLRRRRQFAPTQQNWEKIRKYVKEDARLWKLTFGSIGHGWLFQRLYYLRGFKNFMIDTIKQPPELKKLINMIVDFHMEVVEKWLELGVDLIWFGDDLGTQRGLTISPDAFRKIIIPAYTKVYQSIRKAGTHVFLHTDGNVLAIAEDLVKAGVDILNIRPLQNFPEGCKEYPWNNRPTDVLIDKSFEAISKAFKGKLCLDIAAVDMQFLWPAVEWGIPEHVSKYVRECILQLASEQGGLTLNLHLYPGVSIPKAEILLDTLQKYQFYYSSKTR